MTGHQMMFSRVHFLCSYKMMHLHFYFISCIKVEQNCVSHKAFLKFCFIFYKFILNAFVYYTKLLFFFSILSLFVFDFQNTNVFCIQLRKTFLIKKRCFAIMLPNKILICNTYINSMLFFHYFCNVFALLMCTSSFKI